MGTGTRKISLLAMVDRELIAQTGRSLIDWAKSRGLPFDLVIRSLSGNNSDDDIVFRELSETFGIHLGSVRGWCGIQAA